LEINLTKRLYIINFIPTSLSVISLLNLTCLIYFSICEYLLLSLLNSFYTIEKFIVSSQSFQKKLNFSFIFDTFCYLIKQKE